MGKGLKLDKLGVLIEQAAKEHGIPCSDIAVTVDNELVYRYHTDNLKGDELFFLYSASKPITCTAALQLYEQGLIGLDDPVSRFLPEFAHMQVKKGNTTVPAETVMTIRHLFTMTSGINYNLGSPEIQAQLAENPLSSTRELVRAIAKMPLEFEPGTHFMYGLSHDVLAAVIEAVSGMSYGEYLQKHIFDVCGMKRTYVGYGPEAEHIYPLCRYDAETAQNIPTEKVNAFILSPKYQSGGAGIISCVEDYVLFEKAMVNGELLLKKETIDLMRANGLCEQAYQDFQNCKPGYSYGLGVRTNINSPFSVIGEFGWDGAAGAYVMLDPDNHVSVFYATHILAKGDYLYQDLHLKFRDTVYAALKEAQS